MTISFSQSELRRIVEVRWTAEAVRSFFSKVMEEEVSWQEILASCLMIAGLLLTFSIECNFVAGIIGLVSIMIASKYLRKSEEMEEGSIK